MHVYSELIEAQLENKASDPAPGVKGKIYYKSTTEPIKVDDGTTIHKVYTDQMNSAIASAVKETVRASNHALSSVNASWTNSTASYTDVTNLSCSITTTGRPVEITVVGGLVGASRVSAGAAGAQFKALRGATDLDELSVTASDAIDVNVPSPSLKWIDTPSAGTYTYKLQGRIGFSGAIAYVANVKLFVREL